MFFLRALESAFLFPLLLYGLAPGVLVNILEKLGAVSFLSSHHSSSVSPSVEVNVIVLCLLECIDNMDEKCTGH